MLDTVPEVKYISKNWVTSSTTCRGSHLLLFRYQRGEGNSHRCCRPQNLDVGDCL